MKYIAFAVTIIVLLASVFFEGSILSNQTIILLLLMVLLALFSDLKEFDFWGLKGSKFEPTLTAPKDNQVIAPSHRKRPSAERIEKAKQVAGLPSSTDALDYFMGIAYEIERLLRVIGQSLTAPNQWGTQEELSHEEIIALLEEEGILTHSASEVIRTLHAIREACFDPHKRPSTSYLELASTIALNIYTQLNSWLERK